MENFTVVTKDFAAAGALLQVRDAADLLDSIRALQSVETRVLGEKAQRLVREKAGHLEERPLFVNNPLFCFLAVMDLTSCSM